MCSWCSSPLVSFSGSSTCTTRQMTCPWILDPSPMSRRPYTKTNALYLCICAFWIAMNHASASLAMYWLLFFPTSWGPHCWCKRNQCCHLSNGTGNKHTIFMIVVAWKVIKPCDGKISVLHTMLHWFLLNRQSKYKVTDKVRSDWWLHRIC